MGKVVMNASVSVDGFIAADNDDPGPLFETDLYVRQMADEAPTS